MANRARNPRGYATFEVKYRNGKVLTLVDTHDDIADQAKFFINAHGPIVGTPRMVREGIAA